MPFDTETMIFDADKNQYILTEKALNKRGIFLRERLAVTRCPSPEYVIFGLLENVSDMIYEYIHNFSTHNDKQDCIINNYKGARDVIERAMTKQAIYYIYNGNLNMAIEDSARNKAISPEAVSELNKTIREIGSSILYTGV